MNVTDRDYYMPGFNAEHGGITPNEVMGRGRNLQQVQPALVALIDSRVRQSGVLEQLDAWAAEDSKADWMGGRPAILSARAVLTALMLLAHEGSPMLLTRAAALLQYRLPAEARDLLGIPHPRTAFASHTAENRRWYSNTVRAYHRMKSLLDPYPQEVYTSKTHQEIQEVLDNHDAVRAEKYKARLDEFTRLFLHMTFMLQPREVRRASKQLDVSFDQTYIGTPTTRGYSRKKLKDRVVVERRLNIGERTPGPVDAFAGWHVKSGKGERVDNAKGQLDETAPSRGEYANYDWGWVANLAVRVDAEAPGSRRFPTLVVAGSLSIPNMEVAEEATRLLQSATTLGLQPGIADADKQYWAGSKKHRLLRPALEVGFTPSTDYRVDQMGIKGGKHGALFVEGDVYCPSTPKPLLTTSDDVLKDKIDIHTHRARLQERRAYALHVKEKAKGNGKTILRCPALGPSPTVVCPLRELLKTKKTPGLPLVEPETTDEEFLDTICRKHSASFDLTELTAPQQAFDYGSEEWEDFHKHARNTVESENEQLKAAGDEDIATAGRRRTRGLAAAQIMITMLLANHNIRKIAAFLSDQEKEKARTAPRSQLLRRRDRVWANRYTRTTGNGDLTIPRPGGAGLPRHGAELVTAGAVSPPMRT